MRQLTLFRLGGGCNRNRCDGPADCRCRLKPDQACGCPAVVGRLKGAHLEGCPYVRHAVYHAGDTLRTWAQRGCARCEKEAA